MMDDNQSVMTSSERLDFTQITNLKKCERWTIDTDEGLLDYLKGYTHRLFTQMNHVRDAVDDLIYDTQSCEVQVRNSFNEFIMLSNTQFIENRVIIDHSLDNTTSNNTSNMDGLNGGGEIKELTPEEKQQRFTTAIKYGLNAVLDSCTIPLDEGEMNAATIEYNQNMMAVDDIDQLPMDAEELEHNRQAEEFMKNTIANVDYVQQIDPVIMKKRTLPFIIGSSRFYNSDLCGIIPNEEEEQLKLMTHHENLNATIPGSTIDSNNANNMNGSAGAGAGSGGMDGFNGGIPPPPSMGGVNGSIPPPPPVSFGSIPPPPPMGSIPPPPSSFGGVPPPPPDASMKPRLGGMGMGMENGNAGGDEFTLGFDSSNSNNQVNLFEEDTDVNNFFGSTERPQQQQVPQQANEPISNDGDIRSQLANALMKRNNPTSTTNQNTNQNNTSNAPSSFNTTIEDGHTQSLDNIFGNDNGGGDEGLFGSGLFGFSSSNTNNKRRNSDEFDLNQLEKDLDIGFGGFGLTSGNNTTTNATNTTKASTVATKKSFFDEDEDDGSNLFGATNSTAPTTANNTSKQAVGQQGPPPSSIPLAKDSKAGSAVASGLFDDDEEFSIIPTSKNVTSKKPNAPKISMNSALFGEEEEVGLFAKTTPSSTTSMNANSTTTSATSATTPNAGGSGGVKSSLFDDEEEFSFKPKTTTTTTPNVVGNRASVSMKSSLFDDDGEDFSFKSVTIKKEEPKKIEQAQAIKSSFTPVIEEQQKKISTTTVIPIKNTTDSDDQSDDNDSKAPPSDIRSKLGSSIMKGLQANLSGSYVSTKKLTEPTPITSESKEDEQEKEPKQDLTFTRQEPKQPTAVSQPKKPLGLFGDHEEDEDFGKSKPKSETVKPATVVTQPKKASSLFDDDDDFTFKPTVKKEVSPSVATVSPPVVASVVEQSKKVTSESSVKSSSETIEESISIPTESVKANYARDGSSGVKLEHASLGRPKRSKNRTATSSTSSTSSSTATIATKQAPQESKVLETSPTVAITKQQPIVQQQQQPKKASTLFDDDDEFTFKPIVKKEVSPSVVVVSPKKEETKKKTLFSEEDDFQSLTDVKSSQVVETKSSPVVSSTVTSVEPKKEKTISDESVKSPITIVKKEEPIITQEKVEEPTTKKEEPTIKKEEPAKKKKATSLFDDGDDDFNFIKQSSNNDEKKNKRIADREKKIESSSKLFGKNDDSLLNDDPLLGIVGKSSTKVNVESTPSSTTPIITSTPITPVTSNTPTNNTTTTNTNNINATTVNNTPITTTNTTSSTTAITTPEIKTTKKSSLFGDDPLDAMLSGTTSSQPPKKKKPEVVKKQKNDIDSFVDDILGGPIKEKQTVQPKPTKKGNVIDEIVNGKSNDSFGLFGDDMGSSQAKKKTTTNSTATTKSSSLFDASSASLSDEVKSSPSATKKKKGDFHNDLFDF